VEHPSSVNPLPGAGEDAGRSLGRLGDRFGRVERIDEVAVVQQHVGQELVVGLGGTDNFAEGHGVVGRRVRRDRVGQTVEHEKRCPSVFGRP